jgi:hypothetical protein
MSIINLTPHAINVRLNGRDITIPPSGQVARVASSSALVAEVDGIPVYRTVFGEIEGLPAPQDGIVLVTSTIVAQAAARLGRTDVVSPDTGPTAIRQDGQIVAVTRLQTFAEVMGW